VTCKLISLGLKTVKSQSSADASHWSDAVDAAVLLLCPSSDAVEAAVLLLCPSSLQFENVNVKSSWLKLEKPSAKRVKWV